MKDKPERDALRQRVATALAEIAKHEQQRPDTIPIWKPFRVQLEALQAWLKNDAIPEPEQLETITVGHMALRELGEEEDDVRPELVGLWDLLKTIQTDVMDFHEKFDW